MRRMQVGKLHPNWHKCAAGGAPAADGRAAAGSAHGAGTAAGGAARSRLLPAGVRHRGVADARGDCLGWQQLGWFERLFALPDDEQTACCDAAPPALLTHCSSLPVYCLFQNERDDTVDDLVKSDFLHEPGYAQLLCCYALPAQCCRWLFHDIDVVLAAAFFKSLPLLLCAASLSHVAAAGPPWALLHYLTKIFRSHSPPPASCIRCACAMGSTPSTHTAAPS